MTIAEAESKYREIIENYKTNIQDKNASTYAASKICADDKVFLDYYKNFTDKAQGFLELIQKLASICPTNYVNTLADLESLEHSIYSGRVHFGAYSNSVLLRSTEVYNEYVQDFNTINHNFNRIMIDIYNSIENAKKYQNNIESYKRMALNNKEKDYSSDISGAEKDLERTLEILSTIQLPAFQKEYEKLIKVLDKGLRIATA